jgi:hypothetical protein
MVPHAEGGDPVTELLRIGHGNGHNRGELVDMVARSGADSFGCDESQRLTSSLRSVTGTRTTVAGGDLPDPRGRSTAIVVDSERDNLGELAVLAAPAMPQVNVKLHPARYLVGVRYAHPVADQLGAQGVAHFEAHPPATVMKHDAGHPVVRAYADYMDTLAAQLRAADSDGFLVVVTGDLQASARYRAPWAPRSAIAKPFGLTCRVVRIDWIMADHRLVFDGPLHRRELYDHTAFVASLKARGDARRP